MRFWDDFFIIAKTQEPQNMENRLVDTARSNFTEISAHKSQIMRASRSKESLQ